MGDSAGAEAALVRADEAFAAHDVESVVAHLSSAIREFTAAGDNRSAAMACARLGDIYANALGNLTAARAWFVRAQRLVENEPPCVEQGWVAVAAMGCDVDDPVALLAASELALDRARRFGDVNLETKALADGGLAHVQAGRIAEGMALLDEAMALACGPADDTDAAAKSVCSFYTACYHAADYRRASSWTDVLRRHGLIALAPGGPVFLSSHCDSVQATMLLELGRWSEAEALLTRARADFEALMQAPSWHPDIALADLRIRQGRLHEAEALLLGRDQSMQALLPAARLHLARGDNALAAAAARRGLRSLGTDRLRSAELLTVLLDAELGADDVEAARAVAADLTALSEGVDVPPIAARAAAARARLEADAGRPAAAVTLLDDALDLLADDEFPWLRALLLVQLAAARHAAGDRAGAVLDARAAAATLDRLDVTVSPDDAAVLRRLVGGGDTPRPTTRTASLRREGKGWCVTDGARSVVVADSKGIRYLAELVRAVGVERHALDLVDQVEGLDHTGVDRRRLGDAGPAADAATRRLYRQQVEVLRTEADDALAAGRLEEAEAKEAELAALVAELARAFGLGGRERAAASAAERARLNVTRAIRTAISKVGEALPEAGAALDRRVRTGMYCAYEPGDDQVRWIVQP